MQFMHKDIWDLLDSFQIMLLRIITKTCGITMARYDSFMHRSHFSMSNEYYGFAISAIGPYRRCTSYPNGDWHGEINGRPVTGPYASESQAIDDANSALLSGRYVAYLEKEIECMEHWKDTQEAAYATQAIKALPRLLESLARAKALLHQRTTPENGLNPHV